MAKLVLLLAALLAVALAGPQKHSINKNLDWKVIGGSEASDGQFPYIISLRDTADYHYCGGSILNENWILTAAHCVAGNKPSDFIVVAGSNKLNGGGDPYKISAITSHPNFDPYNLVNDVALLKLSSPIKLNDKVQPIALETEEIGGAEDAVLCGWGSTILGGSSPNNLQFIPLKTTTFEECKNAHGSIIQESEICTLTVAGEGACHGDSGGPLARDGKQIGIVSWGRPCAVGYPDVFSRISSFASWIESKIN